MGAAESVPARFRVGDRVRVRRADPPGHLRTPWYCSGHVGTIERLCGAFANPEELAYNRPGLPAQPLYRVRFRAIDLWPDYREHAGRLSHENSIELKLSIYMAGIFYLYDVLPDVYHSLQAINADSLRIVIAPTSLLPTA